MKRTIDVLAIAVTLVALALVGARGWQYVKGLGRQKNARPAPIRLADWKWTAEGGHRIGAANAAVTVVEFADFQFPFCAAAAPALGELRRQYPGSLAVVFREFPLSGHPFAGAAAFAAECAAEQGAFAQFHDVLYSAQREIGITPWTGFAQRAGVRDPHAFNVCMSDPRVASRILSDRAAGERLGVAATPTFVVNGVEVTGFDGHGELRNVILAALAAANRGKP